MRWRIIRTLIHKELLRHLANRGGLALAVLLLGMALLLSATKSSSAVQSATGFMSGVQHCYIDYWEESPLVDFLRQKVSEPLKPQIRFRNVARSGYDPNEILRYPVGVGAIQIRPTSQTGGPPKIWCWYPGEDRSVMAAFENWFWRTVRAFYRQQIQNELDRLGPEQRGTLALPPLEADETWVWRESHQTFLSDIAAIQAKLPATAQPVEVPAFTFERSTLTSKPIGTRTTIASALILFALLFVCVYLLPSITCEERERGVLLAQALSPASPLEIVAAKILFYPVVGVVFAGILGAVTAPNSIFQPIFWVTLVVLALGALGVGMTIACLTKTQRAASMAALCYMLVVAMILLICQQGDIQYLQLVMIEYYGPRLLTAILTNAVEPVHYRELAGAVVLAIGWTGLAAVVFRRYGWQ